MKTRIPLYEDENGHPTFLPPGSRQKAVSLMVESFCVDRQDNFRQEERSKKLKEEALRLL